MRTSKAQYLLRFAIIGLTLIATACDRPITTAPEPVGAAWRPEMPPRTAALIARLRLQQDSILGPGRATQRVEVVNNAPHLVVPHVDEVLTPLARSGGEATSSDQLIFTIGGYATDYALEYYAGGTMESSSGATVIATAVGWYGRDGLLGFDFFAKESHNTNTAYVSESFTVDCWVHSHEMGGIGTVGAEKYVDGGLYGSSIATWGPGSRSLEAKCKPLSKCLNQELRAPQEGARPSGALVLASLDAGCESSPCDDPLSEIVEKCTGGGTGQAIELGETTRQPDPGSWTGVSYTLICDKTDFYISYDGGEHWEYIYTVFSNCTVNQT